MARAGDRSVGCGLSKAARNVTSRSTIEVHSAEGVGVIWLNRPDVRNAMNDTMVAELTQALEDLEQDPAVRVVVLAGRGTLFCGGGDVKWMQRMGAGSAKANLADAQRLTALLQRLYTLRKPTLARVHGAAYAGGLGLVAACDIAVAAQDAEFCLSEVKLGLAGVSILPYIARAMGERALRRYLLSAEVFSAAEAYRIGLVQELAMAGELDETVNTLLEQLLQGGPAAQALAKELIGPAAVRPLDQSMTAETSRRFADLRASDEAREGMAAFLEKRAPAWLAPAKARSRRRPPK
jgi:methylglutaconyl-CoA hydratase